MICRCLCAHSAGRANVFVPELLIKYVVSKGLEKIAANENKAVMKSVCGVFNTCASLKYFCSVVGHRKYLGVLETSYSSSIRNYSEFKMNSYRPSCWHDLQTIEKQ